MWGARSSPGQATKVSTMSYFTHLGVHPERRNVRTPTLSPSEASWRRARRRRPYPKNTHLQYTHTTCTRFPVKFAVIYLFTGLIFFLLYTCCIRTNGSNLLFMKYLYVGFNLLYKFNIFPRHEPQKVYGGSRGSEAGMSELPVALI